MKTVEQYLAMISGPRGEAIRLYHEGIMADFNRAAGSSHNHQAWEGGFRDHITQCMWIGEQLYYDLSERYGTPPFSFESVVVAIYFHDCEKPYKYGTCNSPAEFDKRWFLEYGLPGRGIVLTDDELNAVRYAHGEGEEYRKDARVMGRLAGFVHSCDVVSARVLHDLRGGGSFVPGG